MNNCKHEHTEIQRTPQGPHYAKVICLDCGGFVRWEPKPETIQRLEATASTVRDLWTMRLTDWEKGFLMTLEKQGYKMSPKQQPIFDEMKTKYLTP